MKKVIVFFGFLGFFITTFSDLVVLGDYFIRYQYYAEVLCINKENPEKECNGSCQLAKNLNEETPSDQEASQELNMFRFSCIIPSLFDKLDFPSILNITKLNITNKRCINYKVYLSIPTPPPKLISFIC